MTYSKKLAQYSYLIPPAVLSILTFIFYYPSLRYGFIFDDLPQITRNFHLKSLNPFKLLFADTRWIVKVVNYITFRFSGMDPFGYRLTNLLMHLAIGMLIFALMYVVLNRSRNAFLQGYAYLIAFITSGLFLLHPTQTQTATYITQMRHEGMVVLFSFAILLLFAHAALTDQPRRAWFLYGTAFLLAPFASGTKEIIVVLPFLLIVFDWFFLAQGERTLFLRRLPMYGIFTLILFGTFALYNQPVAYKEVLTFNASTDNNRGNILTSHRDQPITPGPYMLSQFKVVTHYLTIFFWPLKLSFDYDYVLSYSFWQKDVFLPFLFLLLLFALALIAFWYNPVHIFSFCTAWFLIAILPRASIIPTPEMVCDYKTFLASFGIFLGMAVLLAALIEKLRTTIPSLRLQTFSYVPQLALFLLFLIPLGYSSKQRNLVWSSQLKFWEDIIEKAPKKARAYNNYAAALAEEDGIGKALVQYQKAIDCDPQYSEAHLNIAYIYQNLKQRDLALKHYMDGLKYAKAAHPEMYNNIGQFNTEAGDYEKAIRCFQAAIKLRPYYSRAYARLGKVYLLQSNHAKALECFNNALNGDSPAIDIKYFQAETYYRLGQWQNALNTMSSVQAQDNNYKNSNFILASCYYQLGDHTKAAQYFEQCYKQTPGDTDIAYNCAQAMLNAKQFAQAIPLFEQCSKQSDRYVFAPLHLAKCRAYAGNKKFAQKELELFLKKTTLNNVRREGKELLKEIALA